MKKNLLVSLLSLGLLLGTVAGCSCNGGGGQDGGDGGDGGDDGEQYTEDTKIQTYNFYLDYNHVDEPIYTMKWWQYRPLGACPEEAKLTDKDAFDELFPKFLGYSLYPSSVDDSHIWNFETDYRANITVNLYGIWVAND